MAQEDAFLSLINGTTIEVCYDKFGILSLDEVEQIAIENFETNWKKRATMKEIWYEHPARQHQETIPLPVQEINALVVSEDDMSLFTESIQNDLTMEANYKSLMQQRSANHETIPPNFGQLPWFDEDEIKKMKELYFPNNFSQQAQFKEIWKRKCEEKQNQTQAHSGSASASTTSTPTPIPTAPPVMPAPSPSQNSLLTSDKQCPTHGFSCRISGANLVHVTHHCTQCAWSVDVKNDAALNFLNNFVRF